MSAWLQNMQGALQALAGNAWAQQLQPASWRGVPFHVDSVDISAGDNVVLREYPFQDLPTVFRMGEGAEEIRLSAYVIGEDYQQQRDALRQALTGEGVLIHPTSGAVRCWVNGKYTLREAPTAEGGMARFDLTFVRAEPRRYPRGVTNTADDAFAAAAKMIRTATSLFAAAWNLRWQPGWVLGRLLDRLGGGLGFIVKSLATLFAGGGDWADEAGGDWQRLQRTLGTTALDADALAQQLAAALAVPADLHARLHDDAGMQQQWQAAFAWVFNLPSNLPQTEFETVRQPVAEAGLDGLAMYGAGRADALFADNAMHAELARMTGLMTWFLQCLGAAALVQICAASDWAHVVDARAMRNRLHSLLLELLHAAHGSHDTADGGDWYAACLRMHSAMLADFAERANLAQQHATITLHACMPVWRLSYDLYGTPEYADEILAANPAIEHPLLVPAGVALRVVRR